MRIGLAGDTMLGRKVGEAIAERGTGALFAPEVLEVARNADLFVANLECCISSRGRHWPAPGKPFFFRAPPDAVDALTALGTDCVTLANNHALDFGEDALLDTLTHLGRAGIAVVGAGADEVSAREPAVLTRDGVRVAVVGVTDHPEDFAATASRPGVAYADLRAGVPDWLRQLVGQAARVAEVVLVTPHWGPNMVAEPVSHVARAAPRLLDAGATLVAGHSAHVFHGVAGPVLFDLGDFIDDYAVDPALRNDLGLLFVVEVDRRGPVRVEGVPLALDYCHTRLARGAEAAWVRDRFRRACERLGTTTRVEDDRVVAELR